MKLTLLEKMNRTAAKFRHYPKTAVWAALCYCHDYIAYENSFLKHRGVTKELSFNMFCKISDYMAML